ncbi:AcrR family transcriptional regulator [Actinoalloteichus hoggarensis]|nr:AcrR family transcriptional regulator [Actinoalloteichus hoggarensis]
MTVLRRACLLSAMQEDDAPRSTAEARRGTVVREAVSVFAATGYHATPVGEAAAAAGISQAYVFRQFDGKLGLFVAALERCHELVRAALRSGAETVSDGTPAEILDGMCAAYAELIADRDLLMLQVHAQSAADIPEIRAAIRRGHASVVLLAGELSGGTPERVRHLLARSRLCHLIAAAGFDTADEPRARVPTEGLCHGLPRVKADGPRPG